MNILVTGATGFIGSSFCEKAVSLGHNVIGLDNLSTSSMDNLGRLSLEDNFNMFIGDVRNGIRFRDVDVVVHLASSIGQMMQHKDPAYHMKHDMEVNQRVIEYVQENRTKLIFVSTSEVYGKRTDAPFNELDDVIFGNSYKLRWGYAINKLIGEQLTNSLSMIDNIPTVIPRLFNVIGKRQTGKYGMVVPRFIEQAKNNEPLTIFGDGEQTRSFTYIDDVIDALWRFTVSEDDHSHRGVFNIGTTEEVSINSLADMVIEQTGSQSGKIYIPYEDAYNTFYEDCPRRVPSLDRIKETIGWSPTTTLSESLVKII